MTLENFLSTNYTQIAPFIASISWLPEGCSLLIGSLVGDRSVILIHSAASSCNRRWLLFLL